MAKISPAAEAVAAAAARATAASRLGGGIVFDNRPAGGGNYLNPDGTNALQEDNGDTGPGTTVEVSPTNVPGEDAFPAPAGPSQDDAYLSFLRQQEINRQNRLVEVMRAYFNDNGMGAFVSAMEKYVRQGYDGDALWVVIKADPEYAAAWNSRFIGNEERKKNGLSELLPASYIAVEQAYKQLFLKHNVPKTLFDEPADFAMLIGRDVSPVEANDRMQEAADYINYSGDANVKQQLRDIYNMSDSEMIAYQMDPTRTLTYLQSESRRNLNRANVGGAAKSQSYDLGASLRDEIAAMLEQSGGGGPDTFSNASSRFAAVGREAKDYARLGALSSVATTSDELVREQFDLSGAADIEKKKRTLAGQERARFGGSSGLTAGSLSAGRRAQ